MALKEANDRANMAQLSLGVGLASFVLAMTFRRMRREHRDRHKVSSRGKELTASEFAPFVMEHFARNEDPDYICLAIAENRLTSDPLLEKLAELGGWFDGDTAEVVLSSAGGSNRAGHSEKIDTAPDAMTSAMVNVGTNDSKPPESLGGSEQTYQYAEKAGEMNGDGARPASSGTTNIAGKRSLSNCMTYDAPWGPRWVREEFAKLVGRRMFKHTVDPDRVCIAAGATAILRLLLQAITEPGQGCLIPAPYYTGFNWTLTEASIVVWPVVAGVGGGVEGGVDAGISPCVLQSALRAASRAGVEARVLLLTSPHNPTGRLYSSKALLAAVAWARKRSLHIVVDEIYANCIHRPNANYQSVGKLMMDGPGMRNDVHVIYGPAKDLGIPGWRVGMVYSENEEVIKVVGQMCHASQASTLTLHTIGRLLQEVSFVDDHFEWHQEKLRAAYMAVAQTLGREGIMYVQAEAGVFVMLDLREFLEDSTQGAEFELWRHVMFSTNVNLTPGLTLGCSEPGWFRVCYARERDVGKVCGGLERMAACLRALMAARQRASRQDNEEQEQDRQRGDPTQDVGRGKPQHGDGGDSDAKGSASTESPSRSSISTASLPVSSVPPPPLETIPLQSSASWSEGTSGSEEAGEEVAIAEPPSTPGEDGASKSRIIVSSAAAAADIATPSPGTLSSSSDVGGSFVHVAKSAHTNSVEPTNDDQPPDSPSVAAETMVPAEVGSAMTSVLREASLEEGNGNPPEVSVGGIVDTVPW